MKNKYLNAEALKRKLIDEKNFYPAIVARAIEEMEDAKERWVYDGECDSFLCPNCRTEFSYPFNFCGHCGLPMMKEK